jgi:hypothetical protein
MMPQDVRGPAGQDHQGRHPGHPRGRLLGHPADVMGQKQKPNKFRTVLGASWGPISDVSDVMDGPGQSYQLQPALLGEPDSGSDLLPISKCLTIKSICKKAPACSLAAHSNLIADHLRGTLGSSYLGSSYQS